MKPIMILPALLALPWGAQAQISDIILGIPVWLGPPDNPSQGRSSNATGIFTFNGPGNPDPGDCSVALP